MGGSGAKLIWAAVLVLALTACEKAPAPAVLCPALDLAPGADPDTWGGQRERANACITSAARRLDLAGGPVEAAGRAALAECAPQEAAAVAALARSGPLWPYQRAVIRDEFAHHAQIAAVQARAIGCGRAPGQGDDRLPGPRWD